MFSQKKKRFRGIWLLIPAAGLLFLGLWLNQYMNKEEAFEEQATAVSRYQQDMDRKQKQVPLPSLAEAEPETESLPVYETSAPSQQNPGTDTQAEVLDPEPFSEQEAGSEQKPSSAPDAAGDSFLAVLTDGVVVIQHYVSGAVAAEKTTDISEELLSDYDRELLSEGIVLADEKAMEEFLQDFEG